MRLAQRDLREFFESLNVWGDPLRVKSLLMEFFPELMTAYGDTAAILGADWYDMLRDVPPSAGRFQAIVARPASTDQAMGAVGGSITPLFSATPDPVQALSNLMGATHRLVLQPGRESFALSAKTDNRMRVGRSVDPVNPDPCDYCQWLAGGDPVPPDSPDAEEVLAGWHNDCNCVLYTA